MKGLKVGIFSIVVLYCLGFFFIVPFAMLLLKAEAPSFVLISLHSVIDTAYQDWISQLNKGNFIKSAWESQVTFWCSLSVDCNTIYKNESNS
jgi:hypothetical protein